MKSITIFLMCIVLCGTTCYAQKVSGVIKDTANIPISYATVVLYSRPDTT
ncbi:MAG: hypothetical protein RR312_09460 [Bacteroidales bacterium]